ncbi:hypothetical protein Cantr_10772 [Candida viswanathii]|uniref:Uncharacterized protein n=1 Tax=Candida viswanathii TaxID=5486 RepID=A0A367YDU9_9ASCO|nr:hypothetical protein Cantr_10772 [Candida viswanathii]
MDSYAGKPSFHKEGKSTIKITTNNSTSNSNPNNPKGPNNPSSKKTTPPKDSPFVEELVQTGRPNWQKAPPQLKQRYRGLHLILLSIPVLLITSVEMYRRLEGKATKKVQQGELLPNGTSRDFNEAEKRKVEESSWASKLFGIDFFAEGVTSRTRKPSSDSKD